MSRVTLSASAALVLLLAACGGSSSGDGPEPVQPPPELDPADVAKVQDALDANGGVLDGEVVTLADGSQVVVDAIDPGAAGNVSGYIIAGERDASGNITGIAGATIAGEPYQAVDVAGKFTYSGETAALLSKDGGNYSRLTGTSELELDFDSGTGRVESMATDGVATAEVGGAVNFNRTSGEFGSNSLAVEYTDGAGSRKDVAGMVGSVNGANEGFSALYEFLGNDGIEGVGVMAGNRD